MTSCDIYRMIIKLQRHLLKCLIPRFSSTNVHNSSFAFTNNWSDDKRREFINSFLIYNDFISKSEEEQFMSEVEPHLKRHIYEKDHWDDVSLLIIFTKSNNPTLLGNTRL